MNLDDLIAELNTLRNHRGGSTPIPDWAAEASRAAGLAGIRPAEPTASLLLSSPPAHFPTSAEFADWLLPKVKSVLRARKPVAAVFIMPVLSVVIRIILQLVWLEVARRLGGSAANALVGGAANAVLPWRDADGEIPEDVRRAARMEG